ncbi:MAG: ATP synthase F1 subunit epsilon [Rhodobacteraceae bacterium]|nr:ATP synthase F1 subunit epsilon [Paracoccaceae bacterium]
MTMQFDLVSPERSLASVKANAVDIPGTEGDMTAMPQHAALMTSLRPGIVRAVSDDTEIKVVVTGGFVEVTGENVTVLAEEAYSVDEVTDEVIEKLEAKAEAALDGKEGSSLDIAERRLAETKALRGLLGR